MKLVIVSDTHGSLAELEGVIRKEDGMDLMVHCGDLCGSWGRLAEKAPCEVRIVSGNCDYDPSVPDEVIFDLFTHRILVTHGHFHHVKRDIFEIVAYAKEKGCDIVMYGHTHSPGVSYEQDVLLINPGSLRYPRSRTGRPCYAVMEAEEDGRGRCDIREL